MIKIIPALIFTAVYGHAVTHSVGNVPYPVTTDAHISACVGASNAITDTEVIEMWDICKDMLASR